MRNSQIRLASISRSVVVDIKLCAKLFFRLRNNFSPARFPLPPRCAARFASHNILSSTSPRLVISLSCHNHSRAGNSSKYYLDLLPSTTPDRPKMYWEPMRNRQYRDACCAIVLASRACCKKVYSLHRTAAFRLFQSNLLIPTLHVFASDACSFDPRDFFLSAHTSMFLIIHMAGSIPPDIAFNIPIEPTFYEHSFLSPSVLSWCFLAQPGRIAEPSFVEPLA